MGKTVEQMILCTLCKKLNLTDLFLQLGNYLLSNQQTITSNLLVNLTTYFNYKTKKYVKKLKKLVPKIVEVEACTCTYIGSFHSRSNFEPCDSLVLKQFEFMTLRR